MTDNLLSSSTVRMFGRVIQGVEVTGDISKESSGSVNQLLLKRLEESKGAGKDKTLDPNRPRFARIYAISFEGSFYNLPKPTVFLVRGEGSPVEGNTGMVATDLKFEKGIQCWACDKDDVSLRADVITGTLEEILIDATLSASSRYALASRADLAARADVASRADLTSRADLIARNRLRD